MRRRAQAPIDTTQELVETIVSAIPAPARFAGGHPAKRSFQALRIAVNDELDQLDRALPLAWGLLREGGVLAGICFHSLEDRRVKRFLAARAQGCICPPDLPVCGCGREPEAALLTRRAIVPSTGEIASNPRSSSARLRAARKLDDAPASRDPFPKSGPGGERGTSHGDPHDPAASRCRRRGPAPAIHPRRAPLAPVRRPRRVSGPARPTRPVRPARSARPESAAGWRTRSPPSLRTRCSTA